MPGINEKFTIILIILAYLTITGLAVVKLIKSKLERQNKIIWAIAFVFLEIFATVSFIVYHDYFLAEEKRSE